MWGGQAPPPLPCEEECATPEHKDCDEGGSRDQSFDDDEDEEEDEQAMLGVCVCTSAGSGISSEHWNSKTSNLTDEVCCTRLQPRQLACDVRYHDT